MVKRRVVVVAAAILASAVLTVGTAAGGAASVAMAAHLTVVKLAASKMPNASGHFSGTLLKRASGRSTLTWALTFKDLGGRATKAELVIPANQSQGAVAILLCSKSQCRLSSHGMVNPILKTSTTALLTRPGYVLVYTKTYPRGAIRGRIVRS